MGGRAFGTAFALAGLALAAAGCASAPTPYQPADGEYGYTAQQIEDNRYRVAFSGNAATPRQTVENYLLYRAAEVTLESGNDYFTVVDRNIEAYGSGIAGPRVGVGVGSGGGDVGLGVGLSTLFGGGGGSARYTAYADIIVRAGEKPADDPRSYDARDVIRRLQPQVIQPTA